MSQKTIDELILGRWVQYDPEDGEYIPMDKWGEDHWSTLAYIETRIVDYDGILDNRHMRTNPRLHRELVGITFGEIQDGSAYPTRLKGSKTQINHDDWSCLEDMVARGLVDAWFYRPDDDSVFGNATSLCFLTEKGQAIAGQLRIHKGYGRNFSEFAPTLE